MYDHRNGCGWKLKLSKFQNYDHPQITTTFTCDHRWSYFRGSTVQEGTLQCFCRCTNVDSTEDKPTDTPTVTEPEVHVVEGDHVTESVNPPPEKRQKKNSGHKTGYQTEYIQKYPDIICTQENHDHGERETVHYRPHCPGSNSSQVVSLTVKFK